MSDKQFTTLRQFRSIPFSEQQSSVPLPIPLRMLATVKSLQPERVVWEWLGCPGRGGQFPANHKRCSSELSCIVLKTQTKRASMGMGLNCMVKRHRSREAGSGAARDGTSWNNRAARRGRELRAWKDVLWRDPARPKQSGASLWICDMRRFKVEIPSILGCAPTTSVPKQVVEERTWTLCGTPECATPGHA